MFLFFVFFYKPSAKIGNISEIIIKNAIIIYFLNISAYKKTGRPSCEERPFGIFTQTMFVVEVSLGCRCFTQLLPLPS